MLSNEQVTQFLDDMISKMHEIDQVFESTKEWIKANQSNFTIAPEVEQEARQLLVDAKRKAEQAGRDDAYAQEMALGLNTSGTTRVRRARGLAV